MNIKTRTQTIIKNNKSQVLFCLITTFILGLIAHGYMFFNNSISHDSLNEFIGTESVISWKMQLGRVFWPAYQFLTRGFITLPWLIGVLSLLYIGIAVFFVVKIFNIQSKPLTILITGIFTVNLTVISVFATYINDADADLFAMLLAVVSVFIWKRYKLGYLVGAIPLMFAIGLYQSYISVAITLVLFVLILNLLDGVEFKKVFTSGLKAVCMILSAGILYFIVMKLILSLSNLSIVSGDYNSIDTILHLSFGEIICTIFNTYYGTVIKIIFPISPFPPRFFAVSLAIVFLLSALPILKYLFSKQIKITEKILTLVLCALIPIGMNISEILTGGTSHHLMHFSLWFIYLFIILLIQISKRKCLFFNIKKNKPLNNLKNILCLAFVALVIFGNVRLSNTAYVVKNFDKDATLSFFTRVTEKMETYEKYVPGETEVVFIGNPINLFSDSKEFGNIRRISGIGNPCTLGISKISFYNNYYKYILKTPINLVPAEKWTTFNEGNATVDEMPIYPKDGCMKMIDGVLVVKLGEKIDSAYLD